MTRTVQLLGLSASLLALAACGGPSGPEGLDMGARPVSGKITLGRGFGDEVIDRDIQAGGLIRAQSIPELAGCAGGITAEPTVTIRNNRREGAFHVRASARGDTTMIVHTPAGEWLCSDDAIGLDPVISLPVAERGEYQVWVGAYDAGELPATLSIASTPFPGSASAFEQGMRDALDILTGETDTPASAAQPDLRPDARPHHGRLNFRAGRGDEARSDAVVIPETSLAQADRSCRGHATVRPSLVVRRRNGGDAPFAISAEADFDATLAVRLPDGRWACNDDGWGLNPGLTFTAAERGEYVVYVGSLNNRSGGPAQVYVTDGNFGPQRGLK